MKGPRPAGVTFIAVLTWISGAFDILVGVVLLFAQGNQDLTDEFGGQSAFITYAIAYILIGFIVISVAGGLMRGSATARVVVTIVQILQLVGAVFVAITVPSQLFSAILSGILPLIILGLLFTNRSNAFFRR